ncbi:hypothetical protein, partial [Herbaspirillum sp. B65]|uniref:hypothetical protein n=1 Tax=Herbaspirillum sp. B65 TaxID=137708 RepID=UPI001C25A524
TSTVPISSDVCQVAQKYVGFALKKCFETAPSAAKVRASLNRHNANAVPAIEFRSDVFLVSC